MSILIINKVEEVGLGTEIMYTQIVDISLGTCCPLHEQWLLVSCSPVPHHVVPEGPLGEHGWNSV